MPSYTRRELLVLAAQAYFGLTVGNVIGCGSTGGSTPNPTPATRSKVEPVNVSQAELEQAQQIARNASNWLLANISILEDKTLCWWLALLLHAQKQQSTANVWRIAYAQVHAQNPAAHNLMVTAGTLLIIAPYCGVKMSTEERATLEAVAKQDNPAGIVDDHIRDIRNGVGKKLLESPTQKGLQDSSDPNAPKLEDLLALILTLVQLFEQKEFAAAKEWARKQEPKSITEIAQTLQVIAVFGRKDNEDQRQGAVLLRQLLKMANPNGTFSDEQQATDAVFLATATAGFALAAAANWLGA